MERQADVEDVAGSGVVLAPRRGVRRRRVPGDVGGGGERQQTWRAGSTLADAKGGRRRRLTWKAADNGGKC